MLLAQVKRLNPQADWNKFLSEGGWIYFAFAAVALIVLFGIVLKIKEWLLPHGPAENSTEGLLLQFRDIHRQGELSSDEYKTIREQLTKKSGEYDRAEDASSGPSADDTAGSPSAIEL